MLLLSAGWGSAQPQIAGDWRCRTPVTSAGGMVKRAIESRVIFDDMLCHAASLHLASFSCMYSFITPHTKAVRNGRAAPFGVGGRRMRG